MKKRSDYLKHAEECREMARTARPEHKTQLEEMARTWEQLAETRSKRLVKQEKPEEPDVN
jgi:hypothetical protein